MAPRLEEPSGILVIDKPGGLTSHDVVDRVRRAGRLARVGHTGTLDPFATGVLPLCINRATRLASLMTEGDKGYTGVVRLGTTTDTQDPTGEVLRTREIPPALDLAGLQEAARGFLGEISQTPPMYSAVKVAGKRLYQLAREGIEVERAPRRAFIHRFEVLSWDGQDATIDVLVSKGTYVRTLAEDLGEALGCGAHVASLRRTLAGAFGLDRAVPLEEAEAAAREGRLEALLIPMGDALPQLPLIVLHPEARGRVIVGAALRPMDIVAGLDELSSGDLVRVVCQGEMISLGTALCAADGAAESAPIVQPRTVLAPEAVSRSRGGGKGGGGKRPRGRGRGPGGQRPAREPAPGPTEG